MPQTRQIRVPPLPQIITIEDRADGTIWQLTHRASDNRVAIRDDVVPIMLRGQVTHYSAYDGPVLGGKPKIRLLIRGGRIGYEVIDLGQGVTDRDNARILTRRSFANFALEILPLTWVSDGDRIGYSTVDFP